MKRRLVLLGAPGAGKGTLAGYVKEDFGLEHISSGQLLRDQIARGTPLGAEVQSFIERGELAPDDIIVGFMTTVLQSEALQNGFMLDGFPRSCGQAIALERWLARNGVELDAAVYCDAPAELIVERVTGRRICAECGSIYHVRTLRPIHEGRCDACGGPLVQRADDTVEVVLRRLEIYERDTAPLKEFYSERNRLIVLDCAQAPGKLRAAAFAALS